MCKKDGCIIQPCFNVPNETKPLYCLAHKDVNMVNVKDKMCLQEGCKTRANYNVEGEIKPLYCSVHNRPIVFIRFNPDEYRVDEKKVTSCWGINNNGICAVKKSKQGEWATRLNSLEEQIEYWANPTNRTNKTIEVVQLFYDI